MDGWQVGKEMKVQPKYEYRLKTHKMMIHSLH